MLGLEFLFLFIPSGAINLTKIYFYAFIRFELNVTRHRHFGLISNQPYNETSGWIKSRLIVVTERKETKQMLLSFSAKIIWFFDNC